MKDKFQLKKNLLDTCRRIISERIEVIEQNLKGVRESRNNETKSSAGDKYETGRAMLQIEEDNYKKQLHQAQLLNNQLDQIKIDSMANQVGIGSLVVTDQGEYFISVGLGEVSLQGKTYYCISAASPVGGKLIKQKIGYQFDFNGREIEIIEIW